MYVATSINLNICDLSRENHTNGYPFEPFKPFACRLSAVQEWHEAVRMAVITRSQKICIPSEKKLPVRTAAVSR